MTYIGARLPVLAPWAPTRDEHTGVAVEQRNGGSTGSQGLFAR